MASATTDQTTLEKVSERFAQEQSGVLSERVYSSIRHTILSGDVGPGTWMKEAELATTLAVSRTPLREALVRLTGEGLLDAVPNKGVVVRGVGRRELREIYDVLLILEAHAVRLAAVNATAKQLDILQENVDLTEFYLQRERWEQVTEQSVIFHSTLYEASNNMELAKIIESLRTRAHAFRRFGIRTRDHLLIGLQHHRAIQQAVQNRQPEVAAEQMISHLTASIEMINRDDALEADWYRTSDTVASSLLPPE